MLAFLLILDSPEERSKFEVIYDKYSQMIYRVAYSVLRDHHLAQDAAQISFLKIAKKFHLISSDSILDERSYIYQLAKNTARNMLSMEKELVDINKTNGNDLVDERHIIEEAIIQIEDHEETLLLLDEINPSYGEIIYLKYYRELENIEISELLDLTPNAIRVKLHRALNALKKVIEKEVLVHE